MSILKHIIGGVAALIAIFLGIFSVIITLVFEFLIEFISGERRGHSEKTPSLQGGDESEALAQ